MKDPHSFSIPVTIRNLTVDRALCDLGASVCLMSYSMYKRLKHVNEFSPTRMTLQFADRRIVCPKGILYDVDLRVGKLTVPYDFVIMDILEDAKTPIILGRPCLATTSTLIDVAKGKLVMSVGEDRVKFAIEDALKSPVPGESICQLKFADDAFADPDEAHEIDALQSFLEGVGGGPAEIMGGEDPLEDQADDHDCVLSDDVLQVAVRAEEEGNEGELHTSSSRNETSSLSFGVFFSL